MIWKPRLRLWVASSAASIWLFLLLIGWTGGGITHALLLSALAIWPWSLLRDHR